MSRITRCLQIILSIIWGVNLFLSGSIYHFHVFVNDGVNPQSNIIDKLYWAMKDPDVVDRDIDKLLNPRIRKANAANFDFTTGYFVGDDVDDRSINGIGFSPEFVLLKDNTAGGTQGVIMKTIGMSGELSLALSETDTALTTNHIQSLDGDGFTVGNDVDVNASNVLYYYTAFGGSDCSATGTFCVGTYTGNGSSQSIVSVGFQPDVVIVKGGGTDTGMWKSSAMPGTVSNYFHGALELASQGIESLDSTGFSIGNNSSVNSNTMTYYYVALKEVSNILDVGTYVGNGIDNRDITSADDAGLTFQADFVVVKAAGSAQIATANHRENYGDRSISFTDAGSVANLIQSLPESGGFQVGTSAIVNSSGIVYYFLAIGGATQRNPGTGTFEIANGSYIGNGSSLTITDLGFRPDLVIIKGNSANHSVFRTSLMIGDRTAYLGNTTSVFTGGITSIDNNGFTVGISAVTNTAASDYFWVAFGNAMKPDVVGGSSDFLIGQYIGTGNDNQDVRGLPIAPDFVVSKRNGSTAGAWRTSDQVGDQSLHFHNVAVSSNIFQSLELDGYQKGSSAYVNQSGNTYDYFAFKNSVNFVTGTYTGNGSTQDITSLGFDPDLVWIKKIAGGTARTGVMRTSSQIGDAALPFTATAVEVGAVTGLLSNGFSLGSSNSVNENTFIYQYVAWNIPEDTVVSITMVSDGDVSYGILPLGGSMSTVSAELNDMQTVRNSGNVVEVFNIKGQNTTCPWVLTSVASNDEYVHSFCNETANNCSSPPTNFTPLTVGYQTLGSSIAVLGEVDFHLQITIPTNTSCYEVQNVDITIQALEG